MFLIRNFRDATLVGQREDRDEHGVRRQEAGLQPPLPGGVLPPSVEVDGRGFEWRDRRFQLAESASITIASTATAPASETSSGLMSIASMRS